MLVRIQCLENPRVPPQGLSTEGESGPKIRPKGVVNGQQVKEVGDLMTGEPTTEAPVNGGRNYNGPKVVKFLVKERLGEIDMFVKMRTTCTWTERPYEASLFPGIGFGLFLRSLGGGKEGLLLGGPEPSASPKVTEACKGFLGPDGDWPSSAKAKGSLTARPTRRAGTKVGHNDPTVSSERAIA
ncbi:hypothetical protein E2542_SST22434 [Spatholobus suberectus]|nr:hypothetical protein E2542_SST22434 [Spatholobus suberectus]